MDVEVEIDEIDNFEVTDDENTEDEKRNKIIEQKKQKRQRGKNRFNDEWLKLYPWLVNVTGKVSTAKCTYCHSEFSYAQSGNRDIKSHMRTAKHLRNLKFTAGNKSLTNLFSSPSTSLSKKTSAAEVTFVYHTIQHAHSFNSANCSSSLFQTIFPDSKVASDFTCGRTKCSKIVTNVLAKVCQNRIIEDINSSNIVYSIATDASNKGNIKMFPLVLRYFLKNDGVKTQILNFFESPTETSKDIANHLLNCIAKAGLNPKRISSYCGDNANVNFGSHQSVFTELREVNPNLVPVGCLCHVLSNGVKKASNCLKFDFHCIIIKIYNEFSSHTKRKQTLLEFYDFCDVEYTEMLRHVSTRWLSLVPAIDRLYKNFEPIKSYFNSTSSSSAFLLEFLNNELAEAYLGLLSNIGTIVQKVILKLEESGPVVIEMFDLLQNLRSSLNSKLQEEFYGSIARQALAKCDNITEKKLFNKRASTFLKVLIEYIEKRFDFNNNKYQTLRFFKLEENSSFQDLLNVLKAFPIDNVKEDNLFEEFTFCKELIPKIQNLSYEEKWKKILQSFSSPNLEIIVQYVFSLPHSNAMCERMFSLMFQAWRPERNRLLIKNIEAEILVKHNFNLTCKEFFKYVIQNDEILKKIKSSEKYTD